MLTWKGLWARRNAKRSNAVLLTSAEARRFFLSYLELHAGLAWQFRGLECELPDLREVKPTRSSTSRRWRWSLSSAAAVLAVAAAGSPGRPQ